MIRCSKGHELSPADALLIASVKQQWMEAGLSKMNICSESISQATLLHHHKRNTIGHSPLLVGTTAIKFVRLVVEILSKGNDLYDGVILNRIEQLDGGPAVTQSCQRITYLDKDGTSRDQCSCGTLQLVGKFKSTIMMLIGSSRQRNCV